MDMLDDAVHRGEPLQMGGRRDPSHLPLALTGRLMRDLHSVVFVLPGAVHYGRHHGAVRRRVAAQRVRDQPARLAALSLQQRAEELCGRPPIAPRLHQDVEHVAVLVHGPPQILLPPLDLHEQLVQMPGVALAAPAVPQPPCVVEPERSTPVPNRLMRHGDIPFGEEIFDIPETQAETVVEPDGVTDDLRRKSVSAIAGRLARHRRTLPPAAQLDNAAPWHEGPDPELRWMPWHRACRSCSWTHP